MRSLANLSPCSPARGEGVIGADACIAEPLYSPRVAPATVKGSGPFLNLFGPVLDTYLDAAVGLTGCRSMGRGTEACEYDLLLILQERNPSSTLRIGEGFVDLAFSTESELRNPRDPEVALSLAFVKPIRDKDLLLSSSTSEAREQLGRNFQRSTEERLASSLKAIGRAEQFLSKGAAEDADFWLMSAGYDFAYAWLEASKTIPSPSHLLSQVRQVSKGQPGMFEAFSNATGLGVASRTSCGGRLDALGLVYDLFSEQREAGPSRDSTRASFELLGRKSGAAIKTSQPADSYCFLGLEISNTLPRVLASRAERKDASSVVASISGGENALLAKSVVKALGITRSEDSLQKPLEALKVQISTLTRRA